MTTSWRGETALPPWSRVLVVVAHPDDESFGLGAVIDAFTRAGAAVHVVCLTHGEASTLGGDLADLGEVRRRELEQAGRALGVAGSTLLDFPDGGLSEVATWALTEVVARAVGELRPEGLLVFDPDGITGHPDHQCATRIARDVAAQEDLPVLAWSLPSDVARRLNDEFATTFRGHPEEDFAIRLTCDRGTQRRAVHAHASQAVPGSPLWRRLELLGDTEWLRRL